MLSVTKRACVLALPALVGAGMGLRPTRARADLKSVRAAGTMVIATTGTRPPWTYVDQSNRLVGYDIAWGEVICADLGVKPDWKKLDFRGMLPGLLAGQFDAVMSGVTITEQRRQTFGLSEPYAYDETVALVRVENTRVQQMADLKGLVVAAATGSEQEAVAKRIEGLTELRSLPGFTDLILTLRTNRVDGVVTSGSAAAHYIRTNPDSGLRIAGEGVSPAYQAVVLRKAETDLEEAISASIRARKADGTYARLFQEYFGVLPTR